MTQTQTHDPQQQSLPAHAQRLYQALENLEASVGRRNGGPPPEPSQPQAQPPEPEPEAQPPFQLIAWIRWRGSMDRPHVEVSDGVDRRSVDEFVQRMVLGRQLWRRYLSRPVLIRPHDPLPELDFPAIAQQLDPFRPAREMVPPQAPPGMVAAVWPAWSCGTRPPLGVRRAEPPRAKPQAQAPEPPPEAPPQARAHQADPGESPLRTDAATLRRGLDNVPTAELGRRREARERERRARLHGFDAVLAGLVEEWQRGANAKAEAEAAAAGRVRKRPAYMTRRRVAALMGDIAWEARRYVRRHPMPRDPHLSSGSVECLDLLMSVAGHARSFVTYTKSLAAQLFRTPRTIRNYYRELEGRAFIKRTWDPISRQVCIELLPKCWLKPYKQDGDERARKDAKRVNGPACQQALAEWQRERAKWRNRFDEAVDADLGRKHCAAAPVKTQAPGGTAPAGDRGKKISPFTPSISFQKPPALTGPPAAGSS